ncbi:hypothetical protein [Streptomyces sp. DH10]|uniref:hypothetical protein n=1 Tax=Streptomyces sp. DH10 TaxID=3040121 RepID=UPI002442A595|nr:hypothetical protein [Streptomyces sp. DH10]MDG9711383.1 hypothetical protein [Streptomyces sp. DH10]
MWSTLGDWLVLLTTFLLIVLELAAGTGLTKLLFDGLGALPSAYEARERDGGQELAVIWAAWVMRLVADVVLLPVLGAAYVAAGLRLLDASTPTRLLLALPFIAIGIPLFLSFLFLWDHPDGRVGFSTMTLAVIALLTGFFAGGWAVSWDCCGEGGWSGRASRTRPVAGSGLPTVRRWCG